MGCLPSARDRVSQVFFEQPKQRVPHIARTSTHVHPDCAWPHTPRSSARPLSVNDRAEVAASPQAESQAIPEPAPGPAGFRLVGGLDAPLGVDPRVCPDRPGRRALDGRPGVPGETVFLDLGHNNQDQVSTTVPATSLAFGPAPASLTGILGPTYMASLPVQGLQPDIASLTVTMDLTNNSPDPITVAVISPVGLTVPDLPTLFQINPGEHFDGSFAMDAADPDHRGDGQLGDRHLRARELLRRPAGPHRWHRPQRHLGAGLRRRPARHLAGSS